jgi:hypothetical protein
MDKTWTRTPPRGCVRPSFCPLPTIPGRFDILSTWAAINVPRPVHPPRRLAKSRSGGDAAYIVSTVDGRHDT